MRQELLRTEKKQKDAAIKQYRAFIAAHSAYDVVRDRVEKSEGGFILGRGRVTGAEEIVQRLCEPSGKRGESESGESTAFKSRTRGHIGYFRDSANARAMREERRVRRGVGFRAVRGTVESEFTGRSGD